LTEEEAHRAVFISSSYKAPGNNGLPAAVWQQLWPVLKEHITRLFTLSLETGTLTRSWMIATIVPLRTGGTRDWTNAKSDRLISLLATPGKNLEGVVAERLAYLAETYSLLPKTHFGARKGRPAT
jgi:hypothetical protein